MNTELQHNIPITMVEHTEFINNAPFSNFTDELETGKEQYICDDYNKTTKKKEFDIIESELYSESSMIDTKHDDLQEQLTDFNFDPWDDSINDNKFILTNKIMRIFPQLKNSNNYSKLKIDDESLTYITIREIADLTSKIICHHLIKYNLNPQKVKIIDYTAGVGGNVLSFSKFFNKVYAVEIHKKRYEYLKNNIDLYECKNVLCVNDSSINFNEKFMVEINPNVIFIDPPWGGNNYRETDSLKLSLGEVGIENLVIDIFSKLYEHTIKNENMTTEINNKKIYRQNIFHNKFVVVKLPKNYDIEYFYETIKKNNIKNHTICSYLYILNKMLIIVCEFFCIAD